MDLAEVARTAANKLGFTNFKSKREEVIVSFLDGNDVFAVLPTGYGKSLCYTCLPVAFDLMNETEGSIVVVITPLTATMKDQVE